MKAILESLRAARHIELILILVLLAALGLWAFRSPGNTLSNKTELELRIERLLEHMDGVGSVEVMVSVDADGNPAGAAVVVNDAISVRSRLEIQSAIQALLNIEAQRIRVIGKGGA